MLTRSREGLSCESCGRVTQTWQGLSVQNKTALAGACCLCTTDTSPAVSAAAPAPADRAEGAAQVDPELEGPTLPSQREDEFRPFVRRLPEFKFWCAALRLPRPPCIYSALCASAASELGRWRCGWRVFAHTCFLGDTADTSVSVWQLFSRCSRAGADCCGTVYIDVLLVIMQSE